MIKNLITCMFLILSAVITGHAATYYLSPSGNDGASGRTEVDAWATFDRAWQDLYPGDRLMLLDGVYHQSLKPNKRNGESGKPITIMAKNDGKAILEGDYRRIPLQIGLYLGSSPVGQFFVIDGLVARNSSEGTCVIHGDNNILRRTSCYNADKDKNVHVITITGKYNLVEDCVASGTGRKMIFTWGGTQNIIRRCFAKWQRFDARQHCSEWPWGENLEFYNSSDSIMENVISFGSGANAGIGILGNINSDNGNTPFSDNNKILAAISIRNGVLPDGSTKEWGITRPQPTECYLLSAYKDWNGWRSGFGLKLWGSTARVTNNEYIDIFSWGNAGLGFASSKNTSESNSTGNWIDHATIVKNGLDGGSTSGGVNTDVILEDLANTQMRVTNSKIGDVYRSATNQHYTDLYAGEGARLDYQYIDGIRMDGSDGRPKMSYWPWPMQNRILEELGIDVTGEITEILRSEGVPAGTIIPAPTISPLPPSPAADLNLGMVQTWYLQPVLVTLSSPKPGAVIRYTTDGTEPTSLSPIYTDPLLFAGSTLLRSKAFYDGQQSHARSALYRIDTRKTNERPIVRADLLPFVSKYAEIVFPNNRVDLYGLAEDYTFPNPPGTLKTEWSAVTAPAGAVAQFNNPGAARSSVTVSHAGTYVFRLSASDGQLTASDDVTLVVWPENLKGVTHTIPGKIEAENYKAGGEGIGYHNTFGYADVSYRNNPASPVDVRTAWNDFHGYALTHLVPGEWTAYDVSVLNAGEYILKLRVAGAAESGVVHIEIDGRDISGPLVIPANGTGTERLYQTISIRIPLLAQGSHEMRLVVDRASV
ncbi:MAG: chitobiase/beta-hexosaminidase C-terminal domain-containing protein, partial [Acidobacteria bacterium]|nr:chitobiase/beta-hexosaminidase C-terminal domain-containing protein [Acidobacteriota bacterium]